jgi:hypothetical protein
MPFTHDLRLQLKTHCEKYLTLLSRLAASTRDLLSHCLAIKVPYLLILPFEMYLGACDRMNLLLTPPTLPEDMPAKRRKVHSASEEIDEDEERIYQLFDTYVPLSTLPTPPLSNETSPRGKPPERPPIGSDMSFKGTSLSQKSSNVVQVTCMVGL